MYRDPAPIGTMHNVEMHRTRWRGGEEAAVGALRDVPFGRPASVVENDETIGNTTVHPPRALLETYTSRPK
eukprot:5911064-Pyramimonas_sp.AAC.1